MRIADSSLFPAIWQYNFGLLAMQRIYKQRRIGTKGSVGYGTVLFEYFSHLTISTLFIMKEINNMGRIQS
jgi:hypothetical protein